MCVLRLVIYEDMKSAESAVRLLTNTELEGRKIYVRKVGLESYVGRVVMSKLCGGAGEVNDVGRLRWCMVSEVHCGE